MESRESNGKWKNDEVGETILFFFLEDKWRIDEMVQVGWLHFKEERNV